MALTDKLNAIGDAIRAKTGGTEKLTLDQMPTEIASITTGEVATINYAITGDCGSRFSTNKGNIIFNELKDYFNFSSSNITNAQSMFYNSSELTEVPFELNFNSDTAVSLKSIFSGCKALKNIPKMNNCVVNDLSYAFGIGSIREFPEDFYSWFSFRSNSGGLKMESIFQSCYSLRKVPLEFFSLKDKSSTDIIGSTNGASIYYGGAFSSCIALDEIVGLPVMDELGIGGYETTNNMYYSSTFSNCSRLSRLTFIYENNKGTGYWAAKQVIDLSNFVGYLQNTSAYRNYLLTYNSGITLDKEVTDDTTYQALKGDPDWWTCNMAYSRYNKTSAIETINSLPDSKNNSATNMIKFRGEAGSATSGGAINTMTETQIAVATAKGWTVSFV